jgi:hypothetical protein
MIGSHAAGDSQAAVPIGNSRAGATEGLAVRVVADPEPFSHSDYARPRLPLLRAPPPAREVQRLRNHEPRPRRRLAPLPQLEAALRRYAGSTTSSTEVQKRYELVRSISHRKKSGGSAERPDMRGRAGTGASSHLPRERVAEIQRRTSSNDRNVATHDEPSVPV